MSYVSQDKAEKRLKDWIHTFKQKEWTGVDIIQGLQERTVSYIALRHDPFLPDYPDDIP